MRHNQQHTCAPKSGLLRRQDRAGLRMPCCFVVEGREALYKLVGGWYYIDISAIIVALQQAVHDALSNGSVTCMERDTNSRVEEEGAKAAR